MVIILHLFRIFVEHSTVRDVSLVIQLSLAAEHFKAFSKFFAVFVSDGFIIIFKILLKLENEHVKLLFGFGTEQLHFY